MFYFPIPALNGFGKIHMFNLASIPPPLITKNIIYPTN